MFAPSLASPIVSTHKALLLCFLQNQTSSLLSPDQFANHTILPDFADITRNSYGLQFKYSKLDYYLNPRKGLLFELEGSLGKKQILQNLALNPVVYENIELTSSQYQCNSKIQYFIPLGKRSSIMTGGNGGTVLSQNIFQNELFRLGGIQTIRGFIQESIPANSYAVGTIEFRYLLEKNSNLYLFTDIGWFEYKISNDFYTSTPTSLGLGTNFQTKAGIFSIGYALGKQTGETFQFRNAQIYFGFVNIF